MDAIPISALQHYLFCPRQCALIHNEQCWADNILTVEGQILHERADSGYPETRKNLRYERNVYLASEQWQLTGIADVVEIDKRTGQLTPIEYKHGKPKPNHCDAIQLCAQALCLEEMRGITITEAALWYGKTRHRHVVPLDDALRAETLATIDALRAMLHSGKTPPPDDQPHCRSCSLNEHCQPKLMAKDHSHAYIQQLWSEDNEED